MRDLNIEELNDVQGGGVLLKLAGKVINGIATAVTLADAAMRVEFAAMASNASIDYDGINAMGDYTNSTSVR